MTDRRLTILLVDDDAWFSDSLVASLADHSVIRTPDPDQVFDLIEQYQPDVLLADVMLGARNLFALLHEMQSYLDTRDLPVVIVSAIASQIDMGDVAILGVQAIIDKAEMTPKKLRESIASVIKSGMRQS